LALLQETFNLLRSDVFAIRQFEKILLAVGDEKMPLFILVTYIAGCKPSVAYYFFRCFGMSVVAFHHSRPTHQHLAVFGNLDFDSFEWFADRADAIVTWTVGADHAGFSHAIALQNLYTRAEE